MCRILIENFNNGEIITYTLPLIIGAIENSSGTENGCGEKCSHEKLKYEFITVKNYTDGQIISSWPILNDRFKVFVQLESVGLNKFFLSSSRTSGFDVSDYFFSLEYKIPNRKHFVRPVYIVCSNHDGSFQGPEDEDCSVESATQRISLSAKMMQSYIAQKLYEQGLSRKTFALETDLKLKDSQMKKPEKYSNMVSPMCHIYKTKLSIEEALQMSSSDLWITFARQFMASQQFDEKERCKFLAFMSFTRYQGPKNGQLPPNTHNEVLSMTKGHAALGGGGLALFGTGTLHCWASNLNNITQRFSDMKKINRLMFMDDSAYREYKWANYSTGLGGCLHELCHTFDLSHTITGIMARGFDEIYKTFTVFNFDSSSSSSSSPFHCSLSSSSSSSLSSIHLLNDVLHAGNVNNSISNNKNNTFLEIAHSSSLPTSSKYYNKHNAKILECSSTDLFDNFNDMNHVINNHYPIEIDDSMFKNGNNNIPTNANERLPFVVMETSFKKLKLSEGHTEVFTDYDGTKVEKHFVKHLDDGSETITKRTDHTNELVVITKELVNNRNRKSKTILSLSIVPSTYGSSSSPPLTTITTTLEKAIASSSSQTSTKYHDVLIQNYQDTSHIDGGSHFYLSSALILSRHKWLNDCNEEKFEHILEMDKLLITSTAGLFLIELRTVSDCMVFHHYQFDNMFIEDSPPGQVKNKTTTGREGTELTEDKIDSNICCGEHHVTTLYHTRFTLDAQEILTLSSRKGGTDGDDDVGVLIVDVMGNILKRKLLRSELLSLSTLSS